MPAERQLRAGQRLLRGMGDGNGRSGQPGHGPPFKGRLDGQNNVQGSIDGVATFIKDKSQSIRFLNGKTIDDYRRCARDFLFGVDPDPYRDVCKLVNQPFPDLQHLDWTQTAIIIMDVWDRHPSPGDAMRTDELAAPVEEFVKRARGKGALIIHSPSILGSRYDGTAALEKAIEGQKLHREGSVVEQKPLLLPWPCTSELVNGAV